MAQGFKDTSGTRIIDPTIKFQQDQAKAEEERYKAQRIECINKGGVWDEATRTCSIPLEKKEDPTKIKSPEPKQIEPPKAAPALETFSSSDTGRASGITTPDGRTFLGLSPEEVQMVATGEQERMARPEGTNPFGTAQAQANIQFKGEQLAQQIGQFSELGITPTGLDVQEAIVSGLTDAIPRAISSAGAIAGGGAALGGAIGTAGGPLGTGGGALLGAAIGGTAGFVGGLASSMISSFKSQRRDTTTAQQRVLDEGKQTMNDWITLADADPANRAKYLTEYNKVAAQIDQAYRQMKLDTSRDVTKFETALPNLAEFEAFYAAGGERDTLDNEMRRSLLALNPNIDYKMMELANRRK